MDRRSCRKATWELGRTARYHLRRALNRQGGLPANGDIAARPEATSSESDSDGNEHQNAEMEDDHPNNNADIERPPNDAPQNGAELDNVLVVNQPEAGADEIPADEIARDDGPDNVAPNHVQDVGDEDLSGDNSIAAESDESGEDEDWVLNRVNRALYAGANLTVAQSMLLVLGLMLQHNLTASCVADILTIIQFHCLNEALQKVSLYKFNKFFGLGRRGKFSKHYYCSLCHAPLQGRNARCQLCPANTKTAYFISLPFWVQLQEMFKRNDFYNQLQTRFNRNNDGLIKDIYDGTLYRSLVDSGFLSNPNNISFTWYTDGVPVFKSSKTSMWPIYLCINELPYRMRIRKENILLAGLWFGPKKPSANLFVNKLRPQFEQFFRGKDFTVNGNNVRVQAVLLAGTGDVPAKTDFLNLTLYSGAFGCVNCKLRGHTHNLPSGGHCHVFPYVRNLEERTSAETVRQGRQAVQENLHEGIMGVKGVSALSLIMPDFIGGMAIDVMHKVYGGVVKKLLQLWFDSSNRAERFSLGLVTDSIDKRLKALKPPKFVHRMPRTVNDLCHWKASELKMWFYFYSAPVLCGIMLPVYFSHFLLLIESVSLLNSQCISPADVNNARKLLHQFVREFQELYGEKNCTINVHGLLHLPGCVERLGPLWVYNCFPFEDLNGKLLQTIHGTSHLDSQVAVRHCQRIKLHRKFEQLDNGRIKDFLSSCKKRQVSINERIQQGCYSVGSYITPRPVPQPILMGLQNSNVQPGFIRSYCRLLKDEKLYVSESYPRNMQTLSSFVVYLKDGIRRVGCIHVFIKITHCNCGRICECDAEHYAILNEVVTMNSFEAIDDTGRKYPLRHLKQIERSHVMTAVRVNDLISVCVYMFVEGIPQSIGLPLNDQEYE